MKTADDWKDYEVLASGGGNKLERWNDIILLRPDPQAIWRARTDLLNYKGITAVYSRSGSGGGAWQYNAPVPDNFTVSWRGLKFSLKLMGFKHTGLFPEQAVNWARIINLIKNADRPVSVLNLFGYTGGATVACASAGAEVCHVDAAKAMVDRCKDNMLLSNVRTPVRYIVDDCFKFVEREIKRGKKYDAVIMDPPSFGRGPKGEKWKLEECLDDFVALTARLLSDNPLFMLINSYTTGLQPTVIQNILKINLKDKKGIFEAGEIGLPTKEGIVLPCGCSGWYINN